MKIGEKGTMWFNYKRITLRHVLTDKELKENLQCTLFRNILKNTRRRSPLSHQDFRKSIQILTI